MPPYERPALSKELLAGTRTPDSLSLRPPAFWVDHEIALVLGERVIQLDSVEHFAVTDRGTRLPWDAVVLATGARPRKLPFAAPRGVHVLRTLGDALALQAELASARRLAIVGGGFVGAEVASTARRLGLEVTMLEAGETPFATVLGSGRRRAAGGPIPRARRRPANGSAGGRLPSGQLGTSLRDRARRPFPRPVRRRPRGCRCRAGSQTRGRRGRSPVRRRRSGRTRPLDERRGRRCSRRSPDSRPRPASGRGPVLLVGPVRASDPARRRHARRGRGGDRRSTTRSSWRATGRPTDGSWRRSPRTALVKSRALRAELALAA